MQTGRYVHWQAGDMWLGYLEEFPDYLTQGESVSDLEDNLRDLYRDLTGGAIPGPGTPEAGSGGVANLQHHPHVQYSER